MTISDLNRCFKNFKVNTIIEIHDITNKEFYSGTYYDNEIFKRARKDFLFFEYKNKKIIVFM